MEQKKIIIISEKEVNSKNPVEKELVVEVAGI